MNSRCGMFVTRFSFGFADRSSLRSMSVGTRTRTPFSARSRANWQSFARPGASPTATSGVWSASGSAITLPIDLPFGSSSNPSPSTPGSTAHRTADTLYLSVSATSAGWFGPPAYSKFGGSRLSTTPMSFLNRSRFGSTDFA